MTQQDAPKYAIPDRVAFDSRGIGWRWFDDVAGEAMFSMVPVSNDNDPMYEPLTWFERERKVYNEIEAEAERAHAKHGVTSMRSKPWHSDRRVSILTEELGEVARVLNDREHGIHNDYASLLLLRRELVQTAAMAVDWIATIDARLESGDSGRVPEVTQETK